jgi:peptidoglycan-associated lipoprotein
VRPKKPPEPPALPPDRPRGPPPAPPPPARTEAPAAGRRVRTPARDERRGDREERAARDVYFELDKAELRDSDRDTLTKNAAALKRFDFLRVTVEGHCDERGTVEYNLALGERRRARPTTTWSRSASPPTA